MAYEESKAYREPDIPRLRLLKSEAELALHFSSCNDCVIPRRLVNIKKALRYRFSYSVLVEKNVWLKCRAKK